MLSNTTWQKKVLLGLLIVHVVWVCIHVYLAAQDAVNPWKMGGYGMYVEPKRSTAVDVHRVLGGVVDTRLHPTNLVRFMSANQDFNIYCKAPNARSLRYLITDNPDLIGEPFVIEIFRYQFMIDPLRTEVVQVGQTRVEWIDDATVTYFVTTCNGVEQASRSLSIDR